MKERLPGIQKEIKKEPLTESEGKWIGGMIEGMKLPKKNLKRINKLENPKGMEAVMATWQPWNGEMTLYKNINKLPRVAQMGTIAHELGGHGASPFDPRNIELYGGEKNWIRAQQTVKTTAEQSLATGVYMNGYHKMLAKQYLDGEIEGMRYLEEVNAIRTQLVYENPNHLKQVAEAQLRKNKQGLNIFEAAEENVLMVAHEFNGDKQVMRQEIAKFRKGLIEEDKKIKESGRPAPKILKRLVPAMMAI